MVPFAISYIFSKRWGNILRAPGSIMSKPTLLFQPWTEVNLLGSPIQLMKNLI